MVGLSTCSFLIGFNLVSCYEPNEIKYTVLATDKTHDTLDAACHDLGDYVEQNIGTAHRVNVVDACNAGTIAVEDKSKSAWFGPDWKKVTQQAAENAIASNKWFACSGGEADICFDGYEQKRFTSAQEVCDKLLEGHDDDNKDVHRNRMYPKAEALADCLKATQQPGQRFSKNFYPDKHLLPFQSFCKMDTLDVICENAWYDDDSEVWKLRTSCKCQEEHRVSCAYAEPIQDCMERMLTNIGGVSGEKDFGFERIEFVVADNDSTDPHTKKILSLPDLYAQMTTVINNKEAKWKKNGKLYAGQDVFE